MKHEIIAADILAPDAYERVRDDKRRTVIATKKNRRVQVGPYATFYFENFDTLWLQVQEMLRIEKGGDAQLADELHAYNPLIPKGKELVATVMLEIEDAGRRAEILPTLGHIENHMQLRFDGETITGKPESDLEYTSAEGKASSVQFVHFHFAPQQILKFRAPQSEITVAITHPNYRHMAVMPETTRQELVRDFD